ncbi:proteobacterial dedicated sortase system response regulator [Pseudohongiella sp. SYSU M77423]|uniref:proteobacterial dedicated sortase system response regulator n=1 Tax=Pseudohongiella sp. SYSU M77423 TaxID=3042312 RepID=UPI000C95C2B6|nr:proteobacterial dedicated sortase system response regulator [Pseudohongiella sp. SYSU M77423]MAO40288.1 proteobacterial dedicated sortase system response regulator [Pseudohongiella sp.]MDH7942807.1 proteobacterial dedicated sortase system response regulator [Pseudohongiella sp. SYSU M77423]MEC8860543.1 proteobacterial dedicated sortase system response regulator [Pseudomonadota bacterium]HBX36737.1 proteobacterial dedicated sortase system response regulator [Pseudohongiella sp.]|tara:strand:- start:587062 stop:587775 length:714 start_codon:yes stop_codon:yes gene_type:complete
MARRIAIVEDEAAIRENYADVLRKQGYEVQTFPNRREAMKAFDLRLPNLAIIDIGLENEIDGGFTLCQSLRSMSETLPIIFLTARDNDFDTVSGLRMGADDYLTKDISLPHLSARIAALFRRQDALNQPTSPENLLQRDKLLLDIGRLTVQWAGISVPLTVTEFWMVHALVKFPGHVKSRQVLMQESKIFVDGSTITSHVKRIRKKFLQVDPEFDCIETVYGMGYRWNIPASSASAE